MNRTVILEGETWKVQATGATNEDGKVFCHLAHTTKGRQQRNGFVPIQIGEWINPATIQTV